jgi:hypothetical protein
LRDHLQSLPAGFEQHQLSSGQHPSK